MTDPYNSYKTYVPTPRAYVAPRPDPIAHLDVSEAWKQRFRVIARAGGPKLPKIRDIPASERRNLTFNGWAFFFGPLYFLAKGLWRQALVYLIACTCILLAVGTHGHGDLSRAIGLGFAAIYSARANVSYYQMRVLGRAPWV